MLLLSTVLHCSGEKIPFLLALAKSLYTKGSYAKREGL